MAAGVVLVAFSFAVGIATLPGAALFVVGAVPTLLIVVGYWDD